MTIALPGTEDWVLEAVSGLALEYGWSKSEILGQVYPAEVGPLLDAAYRRRAALNLDALSIACAPYVDKEHRVRLYELWNRMINPKPPEPVAFDPSQILRFGALGVGVDPALAAQLQEQGRQARARAAAAG